MYFSTNDTIYFSTVVLIAAWGFLANAFLLFMIIWRSPRHLSPYRIFLGNTALTQLLLAVVSVVIAPRILTEGFNIVNIYLGPSQLLGPWYSFMLYVTMLHLALNSFVSLMVSMIYRWLSLRYFNIKTTTAVLMCIGGYTIPFSLILPYIGLTYSTNVTEADQITHHMVPNIEKYSTVVSANILQIPVLWNMFCCVVLLVPIYAIMYFSRWKILTMLEEAIIGHSQQTKLRIKLFVKALTVQSLVPILSVFPSAVSYSLIQSGVLKPQLFSYVIVPGIGIGPAIDPIITMYYVAPYRLFVSATLLSRSSIASETQHAPSNINNTRCAGRNNPRMSIAPS
ncbi:hypothetical protein Y032_0427g1269 [Ancylostoma ceylanicum]|uniref:7TM chemoreceptor n=1 Tax=Ancylostoma ceylanicum TaxID=53326 RepID=A0A016X0S2_9BILA|nr:hypothetical protein Y032_0427g1269 [Ancylostoma ceylanicum]